MQLEIRVNTKSEQFLRFFQACAALVDSAPRLPLTIFQDFENKHILSLSHNSQGGYYSSGSSLLNANR